MNGKIGEKRGKSMKENLPGTKLKSKEVKDVFVSYVKNNYENETKVWECCRQNEEYNGGGVE